MAEAEGIGFVRQNEADGIVGLALDEGINLFDTAYIYCEGQSETILGKALGARRKDIVLASKSGAFRGCSRDVIMQEVETSLSRLQTDWIDLYQVHVFDPATPLEETLRAMDDLIQQGKVRYIGVSNFTGWQIAKAAALSQLHGLASPCSVQINYTLVSRGAERELLPAAMDYGVGALVWSPLSRGFLTGAKRAAEYSDKEIKKLRVPIDTPARARATLEVVEQIANAHSASVAQVASHWILKKPGVNALLLGALNHAQLKDSIDALDLQLSEDEMQRLDQVSLPPTEYPGWAQNAAEDAQQEET